MSEETEPPIQPQNDSPGPAQVEMTEVSRTATIKEISGALTHSGKAYKIIEFEDGEKVRAFDMRHAQGLAPGMEVEYTLTKSARTGYWDLRRMRPVDADSEESDRGEASRSPTQQEVGGGHERDHDEKEWGMRSMNALTNATALLAALIEKDIVRPSGVEQACALVGDLHQIMLKMHEPSEPMPGRPESD